MTSKPLPKTFEQFMGEMGLNGSHDVQSHIHAGLRSALESKRYRNWHAEHLNKLQDDRDDKRELARTMYAEAIMRGEVREPTYRERIEEAAMGHEDNKATHAARRLMFKRFGVPVNSWR